MQNPAVLNSSQIWFIKNLKLLSLINFLSVDTVFLPNNNLSDNLIRKGKEFQLVFNIW